MSAAAWKEESQRKQYGRALVELGKERGDIVVLDADLSSSTRTSDFMNPLPGEVLQRGHRRAAVTPPENSLGITLSGPWCAI